MPVSKVEAKTKENDAGTIKVAPVQQAAEEQENKAILKRCRRSNNPVSEGGVRYYFCPVCQKKFSTYLYTGWAYKMNRNSSLLMFCGYTCMRRADRLIEDDRKKYKEMGAI